MRPVLGNAVMARLAPMLVRIRVTRLAAALTLLLLAAPLAADAQQTGKVYRIGFLSGSIRDSVVDGFRQGLRERRYVEGQNVLIEWRFAEGKTDRLPGFAADLVGRNVEVIVTVGPAVYAVKKATATIPIVFTLVFDPVAVGLAPSLARPSGNITGITQLGVELAGKRLELLKEAFRR